MHVCMRGDDFLRSVLLSFFNCKHWRAIARLAHACCISDTCKQVETVALKSINYDGFLGSVVDRFCGRHDFAVLHIIRDIRSVAASWKASYQTRCKEIKAGTRNLPGKGGCLDLEMMQETDFS